MKILSCKVENFGSYENLDFNFDMPELALVCGDTGSGKSTFCDVVPWCLFGRTAKGGSVDEIRSWHTKLPTKGIIHVQTHSGQYLNITRVRGTNSNDLYFEFAPTHTETTQRRGKDLKDTQAQIDQLLGINYDLMILGSYYNEFSPIGTFFTAPAKTRRAIIEQLVDLKLVSSIQAKVIEQRKKLSLAAGDAEKLAKDAALEHLVVHTEWEKLKTLSSTWNINLATREERLKEAKDSFEKALGKEIKETKTAYNKDKKEKFELIHKLELLQVVVQEGTPGPTLEEVDNAIAEYKEEVCGECGGPKAHDAVETLRRERMCIVDHNRETIRIKCDLKEANRALSVIEALYEQKMRKLMGKAFDATPYALVLANPYTELKAQAETRLNTLAEKVIQQQAIAATAIKELHDLIDLSNIMDTFRSFWISQHTIVLLQHTTNELLSKYFDAEITVSFSAGDADNIDIELYKDGNLCSYAQLSKGQRHLLKLCFGLAVMKHVSNHHGISFSTVFIDEGLAGLDENLLTKAFALFQAFSLDYRGVYVVEHNQALKTLFTTEYQVKLVDGKSKLEKPT